MIGADPRAVTTNVRKLNAICAIKISKEDQEGMNGVREEWNVRGIDADELWRRVARDSSVNSTTVTDQTLAGHTRASTYGHTAYRYGGLSTCNHSPLFTGPEEMRHPRAPVLTTYTTALHTY